MNDALKKRKKRFVPLSLLGIVPAAGLGLFLFFKIGTLLAVNDPVPQRLDVIFTFGGENERVSYSRKLMQQFPDAHWVLSDYYHFFSHILQRDGFAMTRVSFLDTCANTLSEVHGLWDWIAGHEDSLYKSKNTLVRETSGLNKPPVTLSVGLVSNPFHMRRIKFMAQTVFSNTPVTLYCLPVPLDQYHWKSQDVLFWWQSKTTRSWVLSEIGKLLAFWFFS